MRVDFRNLNCLFEIHDHSPFLYVSAFFFFQIHKVKRIAPDEDRTHDLQTPQRVWIMSCCCCCRVYGLLSHEGPRPMGRKPSVGVFLRDPCLYYAKLKELHRVRIVLTTFRYLKRFWLWDWRMPIALPRLDHKALFPPVVRYLQSFFLPSFIRNGIFIFQ